MHLHRLCQFSFSTESDHVFPTFDIFIDNDHKLCRSIFRSLGK